MAYSTPLTAVSNATFTAAQYNASDRDNMLLTPAALATVAGQLWVSTGVNAGAMRLPTGATIATSETTASTSYVDLATVGPAVTVTTGTQAIVFVTCGLNNNTTGGSSRADFAVSGATTRAAGNTTAVIHGVALANVGSRKTAVTMLSPALGTGLTAGSNTFTMKYTQSGAGTGTFNDRHLAVLPL